MNEVEFLKQVSQLIFSGTYTVPFATVNGVLTNLDKLIKHKESTPADFSPPPAEVETAQEVEKPEGKTHKTTMKKS